MMSNECDPVKCGVKQRMIELTMPNFRFAVASTPGTDREFPFWERPPFAVITPGFPSCLGTTRASRSLIPLKIHHMKNVR